MSLFRSVSRRVLPGEREKLPYTRSRFLSFVSPRFFLRRPFLLRLRVMVLLDPLFGISVSTSSQSVSRSLRVLAYTLGHSTIRYFIFIHFIFYYALVLTP